MSTPPPAYVVLWWCLCTDAGTDADALPDTCPHHGRARSDEPTRVPLPGPVLTGHQCPPARSWEDVAQ